MAESTAPTGPRGTTLRPVIAALYEAGRSLSEVAAITGLDSGTVTYHLRQMGINRRPCREALKAAGWRISQRLKGRRSPNYKGGRTRQSEGYILVHIPDHPCADRYGYMLEHRLVMEKAIGRWLCPDEVVHHRNGDKADNRIENLELLVNQGEHLARHGHCQRSRHHD